MIQPLIIPILASIAFASAALIKNSGKELIVLALTLGVYTIHSANIMFIQFENGSHDLQLLVDTSYLLIYLTLFFAFQQIYYFPHESLRPALVLTAGSFIGFSLLHYVVDTNPAAFYDISKVLWIAEFIVLILLVQRFWFLSETRSRRSHYQYVSRIYKTVSLLLLLPFFVALFSYVIPESSNLNIDKMMSRELWIIVVQGVMLLILISKLHNSRRHFDDSPSSGYKNDLRRLGIAKN